MLACDYRTLITAQVTYILTTVCILCVRVDTVEVGVHIADVSYFVAPGTALDKVASERATSVYLVQKVSWNLYFSTIATSTTNLKGSLLCI